MEFVSQVMQTPRLAMNVWSAGPEDGIPVLLVHGNLSTGAFWKYVAAELPAQARVIAPDLRGFGRTEAKPINATRGLGDSVDDVHALLEVLGLAGQRRVNAAGWSMGGGVVEQMLCAYPDDLGSVTLIAPLSLYGICGSKGEDGRLCFPDGAASGAGAVNPEFVQRIKDKDTSEENPLTSPAVAFRTLYGPGANTDVDTGWLLDELLLTHVGDDFYPGNMVPSPNWPGVAPGDKGVLNSMSPRYFNASAMVRAPHKPPIRWLRATEDQIVSDHSMSDLGMLGSLGVLPGWPGPEVVPPQPMEGQMRAVLRAYAEAGGSYTEVTMEGYHHGMPLQVPARVAAEIVAVGGLA